MRKPDATSDLILIASAGASSFGTRGKFRSPRANFRRLESIRFTNRRE